jgi:hydroxymethylglutaryl-CoA reductase (NADPH)
MALGTLPENPDPRAQSDGGLSLEFVLGDDTVSCRILELEEWRVRVDYPGTAPAVSAGQWLANLAVVGAGAPVSLRVLTVTDAALDDAGRCVVALLATDEQARAGLWTVVDRLRSGQLGPGPLEDLTQLRASPVPQRGVYTEQARQERLAFARRQTGQALAGLETMGLRPERLAGNIENLIGSVEVPVGLAGPLLFAGDHARGLLFAPMATTEGALVASATRGAIAITRAGGVTTRVVRRQMARVPLFLFSDMRGAYRFSNWVRDHLAAIREQAARVSRYARLLSVEPELRGNMVTVTFLYDTGDAAGQNMSTSCTWHACQWLLQQIAYVDDMRLEDFFIESGISGDKKVSFQSLISGRGTRVTAECLLPRQVVQDVLKVAPEALARGYELASAFGAQSGTVGWNINVANMVAALFTATGQDIACVHESSVALLYLRVAAEGVYASLVLPSLVVGTVGGGTHLPRQTELLELMGCAGPDKVSRFAEIIAGFCLALDLSTLAAIAGGQFAAAHERLGRNRPVHWFTSDDLVPAFFEPGVRRVLDDPAAVVEAVTLRRPAELENSIITELTARKVDRLIGLLPARLTVRMPGSRRTGALDLMLKVKPLDEEVILMTHRLAAMCGARLAAVHARFKDRLGINGSHVREIAVYELPDDSFRRHLPVTYATLRDDAREAYVIAMEDLSSLETASLAEASEEARDAHLEAAIRAMSSLHAVWYGREEELARQPWLGTVMTTGSMAGMHELWEELSLHTAREFPEWFLPADLARRQELVATIADWWPPLERLPRTLIHNDCNPRNLAFRREPGGIRAVVYDWELATMGIPQHDLAELLCYMLTPEASRADVDAWLDLHRRALADAAGVPIAEGPWREGYRACLFDLALNRIALTLAAHTFRQYAFAERLHLTLRRLMQIEHASSTD